MANKNLCILVAGPEGVGKTTQIMLLSYILRSSGITVIKQYIRSGSLPVRILKKILVLAGRWEQSVTPLGESIVDADSLIVSRLINLFIIIDLAISIVKLIYAYMIRVLLSFLSKESIILYERYTVDLIIDCIYSLIFYKPSKRLILATLIILSAISYRFQPVIIILDADVKTLFERQKKRGKSEFYEFVYTQKKLLPLIARLFTHHRRIYYINTTTQSIFDTLYSVSIVMKEYLK